MDTPLEETDDTRKLRVLVLTARPEEHENCLEAFDFDRHLHQNHPYHRLETARWDVRLTHTKIGPDHTRSTLTKLEGLIDPDFVLVAGTAGSLSKDLEEGSIYLPTAVRSPDRQEWFHPETRILHWLKDTLENAGDGPITLRSGPLLSVDEPVTNPEDRRELKESHQALAVDMETTSILEHLSANSDDSFDWGVIRVISDTPEDADFRSIKEKQSEGARRSGEKLTNVLSHLLDV